MDFGRVEDRELKNIDFSFRKEPAENNTILCGESFQHPKIFIGCNKWGRQEWIGKIYPPRTKEKDFLENYVQHYNSVELNATHYKLYESAAIKKWAAAAGTKSFMFCPKMYKGVTHFGSLLYKDDMLKEFFTGLENLGPHLGPIFIQLAESFSPNRKNELIKFLQQLSKFECQLFLELRHPDWYSDETLFNEICSLLEQLKIGLVLTDTAARRDLVHMCLTVPKAFIRYYGNHMDKTDLERIDAWAYQIKDWLSRGLQELYFFLHMFDESKAPELAKYTVEKFNPVCGLNLLPPVLIQNEITL